MLAKSVETVLKLSDFYTITAVRWQYTPHIHALYISPKRYISAQTARVELTETRDNSWTIASKSMISGDFLNS